MAQIDTFGVYVRARLESWGREFALSRDVEWLGFSSKSIFAVIAENGGKMPGKAQGYKPLEVNADALAIEFMVSDMARDQLRLACVLRAYYCGKGRRKVERWETARELITQAENCRGVVHGGPLPNQRRYMGMIETATAQIRGSLVQLSRAA